MHTLTRCRQSALFALLLLSAQTSLSQEAQTSFSVPNQPANMVDPSAPNSKTRVEVDEEKKSWLPENVVILPIPSREPVFGWGLELMGGVFLDLDKDNPDTPPSQVGAAVSYSENDTWYAGTGGAFNLFNDNLRLEAAMFYGEINYRFWGTGSDAGSQDEYADVKQKIPVIYATAKYQILNNTYLGLGYIGGKTDTTLKLNATELPPGFDTIEEKTQLGAIDVPFQYDSRDNQMYPRTGTLVNADAILYRESVGSDFNAETYSIGANKYVTMRETDVLAFRAWTSYTDENAPFYLQSSIGGRQDMRGYEFGRYIDRVAYTLQSEYRWQFHESWIATGFVGVGGVGNDYGDIFKDPLPAAGVGGRYMLNSAYNVTLAVDVAYGKNGGVYYFTIGEAF